MSRKWVEWSVGVVRRFATLWIGVFLLLVQLIAIGLNLFSNSVDLTWQAYVAMLVLSVVIGVLIGEEFWTRSDRSAVASTAPAPIVGCSGNPGERVAIEMTRSIGRFSGTRIANHDVGVRARDSDIDSDDLDIR